MLVQFYHFRSRDPVTGKMTQARYVTDLETIRARHAEGDYEIVGPAEMRDVGCKEIGNFFQGWTGPVWERRQASPPSNVESDLTLRDGEAQLVRVFLRRYVTWCARTRRYPQMQGAAVLYRGL